MAWIRVIEEDEADGSLKVIYDQAIRRAGKVFQILRIQSQNPGVLAVSLDLYIELFHKTSPLSRAQREMIAVVVSGINECHYWLHAHADDLRSEVHDEALVRAVMSHYPSAPVDPPTRAILEFCAKLTKTPGRMQAADVEHLRRAGLTDRAISDVVQVAAYFNYINRIADGLGVDLEPEMPPRPRSD